MTVYAEGVSGIRYSLDQQHSAKCHALAIHQVSGAVFLKKRLNRERHGAVMNCRVIATNTIGTASSALIVLKLVDVNEHAPFFNQTVYYGYVQENMPPGDNTF
ncbi:unnamed protein product [Anisakis simplex]|uniref:CA domain-containing protein n=1 Tax=Anisakis simplex TaxID=6269 RepID=A0A0M3JED3_ANISI|nr:unnamed protein product [Anisakis simplex]